MKQMRQSTRERLDTLRRLVSEHKPSTQRHIMNMLANQGFYVTQATVSSDLRRLGILKVDDGHSKYYKLPQEQENPVCDG